MNEYSTQGRIQSISDAAGITRCRYDAGRRVQQVTRRDAADQTVHTLQELI